MLGCALSHCLNSVLGLPQLSGSVRAPNVGDGTLTPGQPTKVPHTEAAKPYAL